VEVPPAETCQYRQGEHDEQEFTQGAWNQRTGKRIRIASVLYAW
jgi:hypothetical protein